MQINEKYWNIVKIVADMNFDRDNANDIHTLEGRRSNQASQIWDQCWNGYGENSFEIKDYNIDYLYLFLQQVEYDDLDASIDPKDVEELKKLVEEKIYG